MRRPSARAYTLIELLIVILVLGIAAALIVPSMGGTGSLRVQAAVRTIVADLTEAQSDALAFQKGRAVVFDADTNSYSIVDVNSAELDVENDLIRRTVIQGAEFGDARITSVDCDDDTTLVFDEMGSPVQEPMGTDPAANGTIVVSGSGQEFTITIEAYTGRITVARTGG
ncbi:MAG: prepilin-type N-terminal cleavage/methylation domain-containing protein [Phycisphaerales bacterium]|jgi:prepilin-type N-terminal cleavage/methylation domain-containing protein|nr:prepilin-type N-terminal cleavage/methylation domain-containing protein [Phycisphaerales bacterium]